MPQFPYNFRFFLAISSRQPGHFFFYVVVFRSQSLYFRQQVFFCHRFELLWRTSFAPASPALNVQSFRTFFQIDPFPLPYSLTSTYFILPFRFDTAEFFTHNGLYDLLPGHVAELSVVQLRQLCWPLEVALQKVSVPGCSSADTAANSGVRGRARGGRIVVHRFVAFVLLFRSVSAQRSRAARKARAARCVF